MPDISRISDRVRRSIASGQRYVCTYSRSTICLCKYAVAWCPGSCNAPRCEKHVIHGKCATCNSAVVQFSEIIGVREHGLQAIL